MTTTLAQLLVQYTTAQIYARALAVATTVGLVTTTWEEGDPTRTLFQWSAQEFATLETIAARYVASGFLDLAAALTDTTWLKLTAYEQYGYTADEATHATCTVRLTNTSGYVYTPDALSTVFALISDGDVTYRNTTGGTLTAGGTLDVSVECDVAGSGGSAAISDLELVTSMLGVTATSTTAAVGLDEETPASIVAGCRAKLEALSPDGAAGAYAYVALSATLTGAADVTRVAVVDDSDTGDVYVYLASSSGAVSGPDLTLVEAALVRWALPQCVTLHTASASALPVSHTVSIKAYDTISATETEIKTGIVAAVDSLFAGLPVGGDGDSGVVYRAKISHAISQAYPGYIFDVVLTLPAADVSLTASQVATAVITTGDVTVALETSP